MCIILDDGVDDDPMGHSPMLGQPMHNRWNAEAADGPINADAGVVAKLMGDGRLNPDQ
jgi:hypothetical protein